MDEKNSSEANKCQLKNKITISAKTLRKVSIASWREI